MNNDHNTNSKGNLQPKSNRSSEKNAGIALIFERIGQNGEYALGCSRNAKSEQENQLRAYAKENDLLISEETVINNSSKRFPPGKEARVFLDKNGKDIIKIVNYGVYSDTPLSFYENRIRLFNELFPETAYEIMGFSENEKGFRFVVRQPFIQGTLLLNLTGSPEKFLAQQERVKNYMQERLSMNFYGLDAFTDGNVLVQDLHLKNVIEGTDGNLYVIDAVPSTMISLTASLYAV